MLSPLHQKNADHRYFFKSIFSRVLSLVLPFQRHLRIRMIYESVESTAEYPIRLATIKILNADAKGRPTTLDLL